MRYENVFLKFPRKGFAISVECVYLQSNFTDDKSDNAGVVPARTYRFGTGGELVDTLEPKFSVIKEKNK